MLTSFDETAFGSDSFAPFLVSVTGPNVSTATRSGSVLYMLADFAVTAGGLLRRATIAESVKQDIIHLLQDEQAIGEPVTAVYAATIRTLITTMLTTHPDVTSIDSILVAQLPGGVNQVAISVGINAGPSPADRS